MSQDPISTDLELKKYHLSLFFIHFIQAFVILFLANNFTVPVVTNFYHLEPRANGIFTSSLYFFSVPLVLLVWFYLMITAFFHLLLLNNKIYSWYQNNLQKEINYIRWIEYALSSSTILVIVSILVGFLDLAGLFLLFCVNVAMTFFGFLMERNNSQRAETDKVDWLPFIIGSIFGILPWIVILSYFFGSMNNDSYYFSSVNFIIPAMFVLWTGFPINMYLHYKKIGIFKDYINSEKGYILLGLITKTLLAWQVLLAFLMN